MSMEASIGVNLRVTAHSNQGGRKHMEDMFCVAYQPTADDRDLLYAYFGIFDGHGGREAALFAKHHLMDHIVSQKNFWSDDDELVLKAIRDGFLSTHYAMWKELEKWPKTQSGLPSTSGTTASIAFVRKGKLYIGHVGDSGIAMGYEDPETGFWKAKPLTKDHKPESQVENNRINNAGGKVIVKSGVPRVVWNRPRIGHKGPVRRSTPIDEIPFLAVARSLGDLWSYNSEQDEFVVSPEPDVSVIDIDVHTHRCLVLGTDGLWNMLSAQDAVNSVYFAEKNNEKQSPPSAADPFNKTWINPSKRLVDRALDRWLQHSLRADNTSVVTVVVDPPGPPKFSQDPCTSPVGISRYVPHKPKHEYTSKTPPTQPSSSAKHHKESHKDKDATVYQPSSSTGAINPPAPRLPSASHPRAATKTAGNVADTSSTALRSPRRKVGKKSSGKAKRGSSPTQPAAHSSIKPESVDLSAQQTANCSSRSPRENHRNSPVLSTNETLSAVKSENPDDVQIHEISSSSETKSQGHSKTSVKRKGKDVIAPAKKSKGLEVVGTAGRPITRHSISLSPVPRPMNKRASLLNLKEVPLKKTNKKIKTALVTPQQRKVMTSPKPLPPKDKPATTMIRVQPIQRVLRGRVQKKSRWLVKSLSTVDNERSLRSTSRSIARCLRKK